MKTIKGYSRYLIREDGTVFYKGKIKPRKPTLHHTGYLALTLLSDNDKYVFKYIHQLVAETYLTKSGVKQQVNHIDKNRLNNDVKNLEWVSCTENHLHRHRFNQDTKGVYRQKTKTNPYYSNISLEGLGSIRLGSFPTKELAEKCFRETYLEWYGEQPQRSNYAE